MKQFSFLIFFLIASIGFSQNEANIWYFGNNAGLDFNSGAPVPLLDGALSTDEGCATIADTNGNLLFYTDGITVYNKNHTVMLNGTGLKGDSSSTHSAIIIPKPDAPSIYFIFTVDAEGEADGLQYSEVDMALDGGLGGITASKNIPLFTPTTEKITAIQSSVANEYWVVSHKWESNEFIAYNISNSGVNTTPVVSAIGSYVGGSEERANIGQIKISPDGTKLAVARELGLSEAQLFDFNAATGVISNPITLLNYSPSNKNVYGVEFSGNSQVLYIGVLGEAVYQFNLAAGTPTAIINSKLEVSPIPRPYGSLQLAPDGKIYIAKAYKFYIDVIDNPNIIGTGCNYQYEQLYLGGNRSVAGLPPFIQSFFQIGFQFENLCLGNNTQFTANTSHTIDSILWDFGDGITSTLENPTHVFANAGDHNVSVTITSGGETSSDSKTVTIYEQPLANQAQNMSVCDDDNNGLHTFDLTTQNSTILNGQSNTVFDVTYYASWNDYNTDISITNPSAYINSIAYASQTIVASITNSNQTSCKATTSFNIQVFDSPKPSVTVPSLSYCDNTSIGTDTDGLITFDLTQNETAILNGQSNAAFTVSYFSDLALTNFINNPINYQNTNAIETIYVQVVNNSNTACKAQTSFTIEVFELPVVTSVVELKQCDDDLDGFSIFNLEQVIGEITVNAVSETISFHETLSGAENNNNTIVNTTSYTNQNVSTDTVWARIENSNGCLRTAQVNLIVSTTQIPNTFTRNFYSCDDAIDGDTTNGIAAFNFSVVTTEIQALFPVGQQLIIAYYRNQTDALSENNPIVDITNYRNIGYPNQQDVYIRVDSALDNDCLGLGNHISLQVETVPVANVVTINEQCDDDGDGMYAFNTSTIHSTLLNGQTNTTVTYFDGIGNPLPSPLSNPFTTATQTITARLTNTVSQDPNGACYDETTIVFTVDAAAVANSVQDLMVCDDNGDGIVAFDTSTIEATILNGQTGMVVSYTDADGNALSSPLPNPFTTVSQTITVSVENVLSATCFDETIINFIVSEQPVANPIANDFVCDDISNDGIHEFILFDYNSQLLNGQSNTVFEILYFDDATNAINNINAIPNNYICSSNSETIHARIQNVVNPNCYEIITFEIGVHYLPIASQPNDINVCEDQSNDGIEQVDLSAQNSIILNGISSTLYTVTYHLSTIDAEMGNNAVPELFTTNSETIYVRLENNNYTSCYTTTSFQVTINEQPVLLMEDKWSICENDVVKIIADGGYDEYVWSTGEMTESIIVNTPGTYEVTVANIYGNLRCETSKTISVVISNIATITNIETIDWSQYNNTISVFVEGEGDYEYSIDGFEYQDESIFNNLEVGNYTILVRDKNGCGVSIKQVYLLNYPNFFTPNGDGINDTWQIINAFNEPLNKLHVFDRYGKFIYEIKPNGLGWDGTYNGSQMPSSDYWFVLYRENGKQYRGHFSLKR
ncbi:MAG: hypothetical protein COA88_02160 [Kordia sp.]|nr:MAG: hypothetical protein COA88_02160 [Kordia sp.]